MSDDLSREGKDDEIVVIAEGSRGGMALHRVLERLDNVPGVRVVVVDGVTHFPVTKLHDREQLAIPDVFVGDVKGPGKPWYRSFGKKNRW